MLEALTLTNQIPEIRWTTGDDLCDCTFQRIGWWTNPYIAKTMEVRLCCAWAKLAEMFPEIGQYIREIPAFDDINGSRWQTEPMEWNGEEEMPRSYWYRHIVAKTGKPLADVRQEYGHLNPPAGVPKNGR